MRPVTFDLAPCTRHVAPFACILPLCALSLSLYSCLELPSQGHIGEPCFDNNLCSDGFTCANGVCTPGGAADAGPQHDAASEEDGPVVVYPDSGHPGDAGHRDTGISHDANGHDTGTSDAAEEDAADDTGEMDAANPDGGHDAGGDAGPTDAATPDSGHDAGNDTGVPDAGSPDAGDPCASYFCICGSYCKVNGATPTCVNGCRTTTDCCSGTNCTLGGCK